MRRRTLVIAAAIGTAAAAGVTAAAVGLSGSGQGAAAKPSAPTVTVARSTLAQSQRLTGTLGYGAPTAVAGHGTGIVTWLPSTQTTVTRGHQLYRVDDRPVVLLYGSLPLFRTLTDHPAPPAGDTAQDSVHQGATVPGGPPAPPPTVPLLHGHDVDLVAANLAALGYYDGPTTDATYGWSLAYAVEQWQKALGEEPTGEIDPDEVVVARGPVRVDGVTAHLGDDVAQPVLAITGTATVVTLQASQDVAPALTPGKRVRVKLPDGHSVTARVTSVGSAVSDPNGGPPSVPVLVAPLQQKALHHVAPGPVAARVVTASVKDAVHVPVAALLAVSGGGYALELTDHSLVPVTIGMVADGEVQVDGVTPGTKVVVAR